MHPSALFLIVVVAVCAAGARGHPADGTPAARFWKQALPGSPMPEAIADLIQKGIDHSPLAEKQSSADPFLKPDQFGFHNYRSSSTAEKQSSADPFLKPNQFGFSRYRSSGTAEKQSSADPFLKPNQFGFHNYRSSSTAEKQSSADPFLKPNQFGFHNYRKSGTADVAAMGIYFREEQARVGAAMTVSLPARAVPAILPRAVADRAPFRNLTAVLAAFGIAPGSDRAAGVRSTLRWCDAPPVAGERKACANSLEGTVEAATRMLGGAAAGSAAPAAWATASAVPREGLPQRAYTVAAVTALGAAGGRSVACHSESFPYAVYQCHMIPATRAYAISLRGPGGDGGPAVVAMAAICHHDTSNWTPTLPAFAALHTKPGGAPVCHFMPYGDLLFGEK